METKQRIRNSIKPKGLNLSTPDHDVEDGSLSACDNLRYANGAWRNVCNFEQSDIPQVVKTAINNGESLAYIHPVGASKVFITKKTRKEVVDKILYYAIDSIESTFEEAASINSAGNNNLIIQGGITSSTNSGWGKTDSSKLPYIGTHAPAETKPTASDTTSSSTSLGNTSSSRYTYYLDAPLSSIGKKRVGIYIKDGDTMSLKGYAKSFENNTLYFVANNITLNHILLYSATTSYRTIEGDVKSETFFFPTLWATNKPSTAKGSRCVFVKDADELVYFGDITSISENTYTIIPADTLSPITCVVDKLDQVYEYMPYKTSVENNKVIYFSSLRVGALILSYKTSHNNVLLGGFGYIKDITDVSMPTKDNGTFWYIDNNNKLNAFNQNTGEGDDAYYTRFLTYLEESGYEQAFENTNTLNVFTIKEQDGLNYKNEESNTYSFDSDSVTLSSLPYIPNVVYMPSKNEKTTQSNTVGISLTAFSATQNLGTFGAFSTDIRIEHFGNMLIVRDKGSYVINHYLFGDDKYTPYGAINNSQPLSFKVSKDKVKQAPDLIDIPMIYKSVGVSSGDGSLDMAMFIGAAESIGGSAKALPSSYASRTMSGDYIRGEFAMFVVARSEDGTELYRTPPQIFRSENILDVDANVLVYSPLCDEQGIKFLASSNYNDITQTPKFDNHFLVWYYDRLPKTIGIYGDDDITQYERYENWKGRYDRMSKFINPILAKSEASKFYTLKLTLDCKEKDGVFDYAVYATRLHPLFILDGDTIRTNQVKILEETFYKLADISISDNALDITSKLFENLETKTDLIYTSTIKANGSFFAEKGIEYNNCMHSFGIKVTNAISNLSHVYGVSGAENSISHIMVKRDYDGVSYFEISEANKFLTDGGVNFATLQPSAILFDTRLKEVYFGTWNEASNKFTAIGKFDTQQSLALDSSAIVSTNEVFDTTNLGIPTGKAYWANTNSTQVFRKSLQNASASYKKYKDISLDNLAGAEEITPINRFPIAVPNRLQVSETNNPFLNPNERSYRFGTLSNEIVAVNSAAIEMSDAKFGEFPLYVFTKEGVFAMHTGTETLYSSIIPISQDAIINPNTLAVNGAVLFFTDKGLHMLTNQGSQLISAGLHNKNNRIPEWMYTCTLSYVPEYKEVMCVLMDNNGNSTGEAYVFNLENLCWSKRNVPSGYLLQNDVVVTDRYGLLHDITNEGDSIAKDITLSTRPIKLGVGKELKRLETLVVRFEADKNEALQVTIRGSIDGKEYKVLRSVSTTTNKDILIRRVPMSVKYLIFDVKSSKLSSPIRIIGFDTEHYTRFEGRLR